MDMCGICVVWDTPTIFWRTLRRNVFREKGNFSNGYLNVSQRFSQNVLHLIILFSLIISATALHYTITRWNLSHMFPPLNFSPQSFFPGFRVSVLGKLVMHEQLHRCRHAAVPPLCCASFKVRGVGGTLDEESGSTWKHQPITQWKKFNNNGPSSGRWRVSLRRFARGWSSWKSWSAWRRW